MVASALRVALASIPLSGQLHLALGAIPFFGLYAFVRLRWATLLVLPALLAGLLADFAAVRGTTGASGRSFVQVEHYSAELRDLLSRHQPQELEGFVYLGWTVQLIALAGLAVLLAQRRWGLSLALGLGALVPILFALGANLAGYHALWRHLPGLRHTRVPERLMPIACLALAALVAVAVSRLRWPGTAAMVCLLLLVDLRIGLFHATAADEHNRAYAALRGEPAGRLLELPVYPPGAQDASSTSTTGCRLPARGRPGTRRRLQSGPTFCCASCVLRPALASPRWASGTRRPPRPAESVPGAAPLPRRADCHLSGWIP